MTTGRDDDDWFEAMAGRPRPGTDPATLLEATWLRAALRAWPRELPEAAWPADAPEALVARARADGVLAGGWCAGCGARWRRWVEAVGRGPRWAGALGLAAAALGVAVVLGVWRPAHGPADGDEGVPVLRGAPADGVWLLQSADPTALRDRIAGELQSAGVTTLRRYERLGRLGLDADLPSPPPPALLEALRRLGVQPGADGSLRVEVEQAAP